MTDISIIKMIISVAVWRISVMGEEQVAGAWKALCHSEMFWARLSRDEFRSKLEIISFLSRVMSVSKSCFCSPCFSKIWRPTFKLWGFWFRRCMGGILENSAQSPGNFYNSDYNHEYFLKIFFLFSKAEPELLGWQLLRSLGWAKHFGDGTSRTTMKTWFPGIGEIEHRRTVDCCRDWCESRAVRTHGPK